jgi:hypothetical protein
VRTVDVEIIYRSKQTVDKVWESKGGSSLACRFEGEEMSAELLSYVRPKPVLKTCGNAHWTYSFSRMAWTS